MKQQRIEQLVFLFLLFALFSWATWSAADFKGQARTFPFWVGTAAMIFVSIEFFLTLFREKTQKADSLIQAFVQISPYLLWITAYFGGIYLMGMIVASTLFVAFSIWRMGEVPWHFALIGGLAVAFFLILLTDVMNLKWPPSLLDPLSLLGINV